MNELHLFAGAGGGILGSMLLGHTCVCAVEIEPYRRQMLLQRQRDGILPKFPIWDDVRTFDGKPWHGKVDIVSGGFPCQDISPSGTRKGIHGDRSGLWKEMARIIREVGPMYAFVENSSNLTVRGLGTVLRDLAEMGFNARWGVLGAADAIWLDGTPTFDHERLRCFIKAFKPVDTVANSHENRLQPEETSKKIHVHSQRHIEALKRKWSAITMSVGTTNNGWWTHEPGVGRVAHGMAHRVDRLEAIGDGQVPAVVKLAWESLD